MSEPIAEILSQFTPDRGNLDRDALLFAAGRASVRPQRRWIALAGALATTQVLTLLLLPWSKPAPPNVGYADARPTAPAAAASPAEGSILNLRRRAMESEGEWPAATIIEPSTSPGAPLLAFPASRALLD